MPSGPASPQLPSPRHTVEVGKPHWELVPTLIKFLDISGPLLSDLENEGAGLGDSWDPSRPIYVIHLFWIEYKRSLSALWTVDVLTYIRKQWEVCILSQTGILVFLSPLKGPQKFKYTRSLMVFIGMPLFLAPNWVSQLGKWHFPLPGLTEWTFVFASACSTPSLGLVSLFKNE